MTYYLEEFILQLGSKLQTTSVLSKLLITIILLFALYLINKSVCTFLNRIDLSSQHTIKIKKMASIFIKLLFFIVVIPIWMDDSKDIFTFLGLFSAGLAFAFKDVLGNFFGWIIISTQKPFEIGDRIKIGDSIGDVVEVDWFYTTIIEVVESNSNTYGQSTGRLTHIPNIKILTEHLINETNSFPFTWHEIDIVVDSTSNWEKAKKIIMTVADDILGNIESEAKESLNIASKTLPIYYENLSHTIYTSLENGRIVLSLRFICKARNFRNLNHILTENILTESFKHEDIHFV